ncbi:MAG: Na+/H+ antiporter NhaA [Sandaracinaceae bacterium]|nr:Na+/H+ antiporter NhaA [Sandaracinaceae bacterium]
MSTSITPGPGPLSSPPPEAWEPLVRVARLAGRPLERFLRIEAASGILLLLSAAAALAWANSSWASSYDYVWHTPVGVRLGGFSFERSLEWYVNDALMVIFFFVVGLEIRREMHHGELSEWRRAAIPAAAALGGMLAPAGLYLAFAGEPATRSGWGVPMATDIAFAVGILTLLGKRAPAALRVLLLAVAVIDDLGAIVVIALFYSSGVSLVGLLVAALGVLGVFAMQRLGVRSKLAYIAPAFVAWAGIYAAGIHPTIAGVIVGLITPVRAWLGPEGFVAGVRPQLERLSQAAPGSLDPHELAETLRVVDAARREAMSPAESLIEKLHPFVAFGIMPIFALANAGVTVSGGALDADSWRVATAVTVGLVVGKPLGVLLAMCLALRFRLGTLPVGLTMRHLLVLGVVAGVGFTMALFIAALAFTDAHLLAAAKLGVLAASGAAGVLALVLGRVLLTPVGVAGAAETADEAESSTAL